MIWVNYKTICFQADFSSAIVFMCGHIVLSVSNYYGQVLSNIQSNKKETSSREKQIVFKIFSFSKMTSVQNKT